MKKRIAFLGFLYVLVLCPHSVSASEKTPNLYDREEKATVYSYWGTSAKLAGAEEIPLSFERRSYQFCYRPRFAIDEHFRGTGRCNFHTLWKPSDWLTAEGICSNRIEDGLQGFLKKVNPIVIENNFIVGGDPWISSYLFLTSAPCNFHFFEIEERVVTRQGVIPSWVLGVHLLYTSYGEVDSWPLPTLGMKNEFLRQFSDFSQLNDTHREYLQQAWMKFLKGNSDRIMRWIPFPANHL
jgi:hypothetical protein